MSLNWQCTILPLRYFVSLKRGKKTSSLQKLRNMANGIIFANSAWSNFLLDSTFLEFSSLFSLLSEIAKFCIQRRFPLHTLCTCKTVIQRCPSYSRNAKATTWGFEASWVSSRLKKIESCSISHNWIQRQKNGFQLIMAVGHNTWHLILCSATHVIS